MTFRYPLTTKTAEWALRHNLAQIDPKGIELAWLLWFTAFEASTSLERDALIERGAEIYRNWHLARFESAVEDDYVIGPHLQTLLDTSDQDERVGALEGLLNGETGRLDCGLLWSWLEGQRSGKETS